MKTNKADKKFDRRGTEKACASTKSIISLELIWLSSCPNEGSTEKILLGR